MFRFRAIINNTYRRQLIDEYLDKYKYLYKGNVIDIGGKKKNPRGFFKPPFSKVHCWDYLNNDKNTNPDIISELPIIDVQDKKYDVALLSEVIEYIYSYESLLKEINRILKKDGILIISSPFHNKVHGDYEKDYFRFTKSFFKIALKKNNFEIVSIEEMGGKFDVIADFLRPKKVLFIIFFYFLISFLKKLFSNHNNYQITTGYFIIATKI